MNVAQMVSVVLVGLLVGVVGVQFDVRSRKVIWPTVMASEFAMSLVGHLAGWWP